MKRNGKQPVVSVIVPTYNAGEFVAQCLDSVLGQTMGDFELICVDDGSTDDTWAIVEERAQRDGRVAALRQANAGPGAARNAGLERACGRYVYCLDADDYLDRDMLASCVKALDDAQADMALVAFRTYNQRAGRTYPAEWGMRHEDAFPSYPAGSFTWETAPDLFFETVQNVPWNKMVRRSLLEERGIRSISSTRSPRCARGCRRKACTSRCVWRTRRGCSMRCITTCRRIATSTRSPSLTSDWLPAGSKRTTWRTSTPTAFSTIVIGNCSKRSSGVRANDSCWRAPISRRPRSRSRSAVSRTPRDRSSGLCGG